MLCPNKTAYAWPIIGDPQRSALLDVCFHRLSASSSMSGVENTTSQYSVSHGTMEYDFRRPLETEPQTPSRQMSGTSQRLRMCCETLLLTFLMLFTSPTGTLKQKMSIEVTWSFLYCLCSFYMNSLLKFLSGNVFIFRGKQLPRGAYLLHNFPIILQ